MLGGADNPNGELPSYITGADSCTWEKMKILSVHGLSVSWREYTVSPKLWV